MERETSRREVRRGSADRTRTAEPRLFTECLDVIHTWLRTNPDGGSVLLTVRAADDQPWYFMDNPRVSKAEPPAEEDWTFPVFDDLQYRLRLSPDRGETEFVRIR